MRRKLTRLSPIVLPYPLTWHASGLYSIKPHEHSIKGYRTFPPSLSETLIPGFELVYLQPRYPVLS